MAFWKRRGARHSAPAVGAVQTAPRDSLTVRLPETVPLMRAETRLLRAVYDAVPLVAAAVQKLVRLTGGFTVTCDNGQAERELREFLLRVPVGACSTGMDAFLDQYLEQLLICGNAVGEMVLSRAGDDIAGLYNAPLEGLELATGDSPLEMRLYVDRPGGRTPVRWPGLICVSALDPAPGRVEGTSLLSGLPFVSSILMGIFQTVGVNFDRVGNLRFAVTYKPTGDPLDQQMARERAGEIAREWSRAMQGGAAGKISDFVAVGDVRIQTIGADCPLPDTEIPVRQMLEQIVARLGVPPFLLGLSWSATERMSAQQADILTSEIDAYRRLLTPVIDRVCATWLTLHGYDARAAVIWQPVNLQDEVELARARLLRAQAAATEQQLPPALREGLTTD